MKGKNILKEAGVLLIGALFIFSSVAAMATTSDKNRVTSPSSDVVIPFSSNTGPCSIQNNVILWDNYCLDWVGGPHSQDDPPEVPQQRDSFGADDFQFDEQTEVHWVFWQLAYWFCNLAEGPKDYHYDWNITFFNDDGSGYRPGDIFAGPFTIADADIYKSLPYQNSTIQDNGIWSCGAYAFLPEPVTFNADTKYWISIYSIGPHFPQTAWYQHNESQGGILLHESVWKSEFWGYPNWTNLSVLFGEPVDANFILGGDPPFEVSVSKGLGVTATIISNLPAVGDPATNLTVTFTATGGFVLTRTKTVVIAEFESGTTETIKWFPIGFGRIAIDVDCTSVETGIGVADTTGFLILFFLI